MAGYVFSVSKDGWKEFCENCLRFGFFTPFTSFISEEIMQPQKVTSRKKKNQILASTYGDFITMRPGDNIYFLSQRKIYGIGKAIKIGLDCKYDNYYNASALLPNCRITPKNYLTTEDSRARWVCLFVPAPYFFMKGADMDDVLRYRPNSFKALRTFEELTFIKIDDEENRALKEYISLINEPSYENIENMAFGFNDAVHQRLKSMELDDYVMDLKKSLDDQENKEYVFSEMLIESILMQSIINDETQVFGRWDYLSHQLIASPFKPLTWIDTMDVFGYRYSENYNESPKLITKYLLIELKKGAINAESVKQTMQYVDWICSEYASGDYSRIEAYVVGNRVVNNIDKVITDSCQRTFILETHPVKPAKWSGLKLIKYRIDNGISFEEIN